MPVPLLFKSQVKRNPLAVALVAEEETSYEQLDRWSDTLASRFQQLGAGPEKIVALLADRSPAFVAGALGALKAGAAYLPLDPAAPTERLAWMLEDSAPVVLAHQAKASLPPGVMAARLNLEDPALRLEGESCATPRLHENGAAYVIYTSGSTGRPKGVVISHGGLSRLVAWHCQAYAVTSDDRGSLIANVAFDASVWELWPYLCSGASVFVVSGRVDPLRVLPTLAEAGVSISFLPTPVAETALEATAPAAGLPRVLLTGGDRLRQAPKPGLPPLVNHYGPTENTVVATAGPVYGDDLPPPIGTPIDNVDVYVLDAALELVRRGEEGELFLAGPQLARGYLGRPDLTAAAFLPDPWDDSGRMYRTGDRVRMRLDGTLEFRGRLDSQVKVHGQRIELGEVEVAMLAHSGVSSAAAAVHQGPTGMRLVGYLVGEPGRPLPDAPEMREFLSRILPGAMVPTAFVSLSELPLTANGKIDRVALPAPERGERDLATPVREPATAVESALVTAFAEVLGLAQVGAEDDFFALGGSSLQAAHVALNVGRQFDLSLPGALLFAAPTPALAAVEVSQRLERPTATVATPELGDVWPLSPGQLRLWLGEQWQSDEATAYNVGFSFRLRGQVDLEALARACVAVAGHHEALRTRFKEVDGQPVQELGTADPPDFGLVDLRPAGEAGLTELLATDVRRPFDLACSPCRFTCYRLADDDVLLVFVAHHLVIDGFSMQTIADDISTASHSPSVLPQASRYADYLRALGDRERQGDFRPQLEYWQQQLAGAPKRTVLVSDRPRGSTQTFAGTLYRSSLSKTITTGVSLLARRHRTTPFTVLFTAFAALLRDNTGQDDLVVGTASGGRNDIQLDNLVGYTVNLIALRCRLEGARTFADLLTVARDALSGAWAHQDVPFERVLEALALSPSPSSSPLFQIAFVHEPVLPALTLPRVSSETATIDTGSAKLELTWMVYDEVGGRTAMEIEYNTDLFDATTVAAWSTHFERLLEDAIEDDERPLLELVGEKSPRPASAPPPLEMTDGGTDGGQGRGAWEWLVVEVWEEVLGQKVTRDDDFFALGGDSLSGARVAGRLRERAGAEVALEDIFREPRLKGLAALVAARAG